MRDCNIGNPHTSWIDGPYNKYRFECFFQLQILAEEKTREEEVNKVAAEKEKVSDSSTTIEEAAVAKDQTAVSQKVSNQFHVRIGW